MMRKKLPSHGDRRIRERFLLLPKTVDREIRWLERARWSQFYSEFACIVNGKWIDHHWEDCKEE